jgi:hypothetical protein
MSWLETVKLNHGEATASKKRKIPTHTMLRLLFICGFKVLKKLVIKFDKD